MISRRTAGRAGAVLAAGRVALGVGLIAAPAAFSRGWIGETADTPAGAAAMRALGIRDVILGGITLHTLSHPEVAPRWVLTCGVADAVDCAATVSARRGLPAGAAGVIALAGGSALASAVVARALKTAG